MDVIPLADVGPRRRAALVERDAGVDAVADRVADIVTAVRADGDDALRRFAREFDDVAVDDLDVTDAAPRAYDAIDPALRDAIDEAAANVRAFHEAQVPEEWRADFDGRSLGRRFRPIDRVGAYVPGGSAAYPSSALMTVVPAVVAGVDEVVVTTPPAANLPDATLAAIHAAGADEVYAVGGAQAVAALAYGTETIDPVRAVVGPGGRWVTAAKAAVRGDVAIDFLAGPSEVLVLADGTADPDLVAADLVAQAEHDPHASVVAVVTDAAVADAVAAAVEERARTCDRQDVVAAALDGDQSGVFLAADAEEAVAFADDYAAEHLSVQAADAAALADRVDSAGSVFVGAETPVAAGDYASGTNHVLPTGGGAAAVGGLSVDTFLRAQTVQELDGEALSELRETITTLAEAEGLTAHAASVEARFEGRETRTE